VEKTGGGLGEKAGFTHTFRSGNSRYSRLGGSLVS
jgi:hypothetical protein